MKTRIVVVVAVVAFAFTSCLTPSSQSGEFERPDVPSSETPPVSSTRTGPRKIDLDAQWIDPQLGSGVISEQDVGGFYSWVCGDIFEPDRTLVEVGYFGDSLFDGLGFILFDGGNVGEFTFYRRQGLDRRWDFGPGVSYAFLIEPDGTGLYYDFTMSKGGTASASAVYDCRQR